MWQKELRDFRVKISKAAHETYEAREGTHDDLVLSLAIALFVAENQGPPAIDLSTDEMERIWAEEDGEEVDSRTLTQRPQLQRAWSGHGIRRYW